MPLSKKAQEVYDKIFCDGLGSYMGCPRITMCHRSSECFVETLRLETIKIFIQAGKTEEEGLEYWLRWCSQNMFKVDAEGHLVGKWRLKSQDDLKKKVLLV